VRARRPPARRRDLAPLGLALAAAAVTGGVAATLRRRLARSDLPAAEPAALADWFDEGELGPNRRYRRGAWALAAAGMPLGPLGAVLVHRTGGRWRAPLSRLTGGCVPLSGALFGVGLAGAGTLAGLPLAAARYGWGRRAGPVTQPVAGWAGDVVKATAVEAVLLGAVGGATATLLRRAPRGWPVGLAALAGGGTLLVTFLAPRLIEPLFQRTRRLDDPELAGEVLQLAHRAGVPAREVLVNDASRRTRAPNAYVSGLGRTRRVVLFDTLVRDLPRDEVRYVVAHELAHVSRRHLARGIAWSAAFGACACAALAALVGWRTGWSRPDADLALRRLSLLVAGAGALGAAGAPLGAALSRQHEREADWDAVRLTGEPGAAIRAHQSLVRQGMGVPDPPRWVRLWGTHPTALERIGLALRAGG
jgi:STE24 endopeptidase